MTKNCCEIDMRHDRFQAIISGANPIPPGAIRMAYRRWPGPPADVDLGHAACRHVRACRLFKARTATRSRHPGVDARGECGVVNQGRRSIQKAHDQFPGAGFIFAMLKIYR
jgi:hypothetical protein